MNIEKGHDFNDKIVMKGCGNEEVGKDIGDVVGTLVKQDDSNCIFKRIDNDLYMSKKISLKDALCGVHFYLNTLDDRNIEIEGKDGVRPNECWMVEGEGFPIKGTDNKGNLIINFEIVYPERSELSEWTKLRLRKALPDVQSEENAKSKVTSKCTLVLAHNENSPKKDNATKKDERKCSGCTAQ